jgi:hypothetical protein
MMRMSWLPVRMARNLVVSWRTPSMGLRGEGSGARWAAGCLRAWPASGQRDYASPELALAGGRRR